MYYPGSAGGPVSGVWSGCVHYRHSLLQKEMCAKEATLRTTKLTINNKTDLIIIIIIDYVYAYHHLIVFMILSLACFRVNCKGHDVYTMMHDNFVCVFVGGGGWWTVHCRIILIVPDLQYYYDGNHV